jgi:hypothetical protein
MTWNKPKFEFVDRSSEVTSTSRASRLTWIKPEFEFVDACCEVTLYMYHR